MVNTYDSHVLYLDEFDKFHAEYFSIISFSVVDTAYISNLARKSVFEVLDKWWLVESNRDHLRHVRITCFRNQTKETIKTIDRNKPVASSGGTLYRFVLGHDVDALLSLQTPFFQHKKGDSVRKFLAALSIEGCSAFKVLIKHRSDREIRSTVLFRIPIVT